MMDTIFLICMSYSLIRVVISARGFRTPDGESWRFVVLLLLAAVTAVLWYAVRIPGLNLVPVAIRLPCIIAASAALGIVSRKTALALKARVGDDSRDAMHACNAMLVTSVVAVLIAALSGVLVVCFGN